MFAIAISLPCLLLVVSCCLAGAGASPESRRLLAAPSCSKLHPACTKCKNTRIIEDAHTRTVLLCTSCAPGWRLRAGDPRFCDCAPGFYAERTECNPCKRGQYCPGKPANAMLPCPDGLATIVIGAKGQSQCMTTPGWGRSFTKEANGGVGVKGTRCPLGTYNIGANTMGCQQCGPGLTTRQQGSSSAAACVAPPGWYIRNGAGSQCPKGTFTADYNQDSFCMPCDTGLTTRTEGSIGASACSVAARGHFLQLAVTDQEVPPTSPAVANTTGNSTDPGSGGGNNTSSWGGSTTYIAQLCPRNTYQDTENSDRACKPCPNGLITEGVGAAGVELCMTPPGFELVPGATNMTPCAIGWFKAGWNSNPCISCGQDVLTDEEGSIAITDCYVPPGMGVIPRADGVLQAVPCLYSTYGRAERNHDIKRALCMACPQNLVTPDSVTGVLPSDTSSNSSSNSSIDGSSDGSSDGVPPGYTSQLSCVLRPGWGFSALTQAPEKCALGFFSPGLHRLDCTACPSGFTTLAEGATSQDDCVVQKGWAMDEVRMLPRPCDKGEFSTGGTADRPWGECTPCPEGFTSQEDQSQSPDECNLCGPGFGGVNCTACPPGTFAFGGQAEGDDCRPCPSGMTSARGAQDNAECVQVWPLSDASYIDLLPLSDDRAWVDVPLTNAGPSSNAACKRRCGPGCIMYRFFYAEDASGLASRCQVLPEMDTSSPGWGSRAALGFKAWGSGAVIDFAFYYVAAALGVGELLEEKGSGKTLRECTAACSRRDECLLVRLTGGGGSPSANTTYASCGLYTSVLDAEWFSEYRIAGVALSEGGIVVSTTAGGPSAHSSSPSPSPEPAGNGR